MTRVSTSEYSLGSANESTGWFDTFGVNGDIAFNITGTFVGTIALQVSNQADATKTRFSTVTSYTAVQPPLDIPCSQESGRIARYFRFILTAYTSGTAYVGIDSTYDTLGQPVVLSAQSAVAGGA